MGREYLSYLVRLWRVCAPGMPIRRASLQRPSEGEQRSFAGLDEMMAFLRAETEERDEEEVTDTEAPMNRSGSQV